MKRIMFLAAILLFLAACKKDETDSEPPKSSTAPEIILRGPAEKYMVLNQPYIEEGYQATDKEDGEISWKVITKGSVNNNKSGSYLLTYCITDSEGLSDSVQRKVYVENEAQYYKGKYKYSLYDTANTLLNTYTDSLTVSDTLNNCLFAFTHGWPSGSYKPYFILNPENKTLNVPLQLYANLKPILWGNGTYNYKTFTLNLSMIKEGVEEKRILIIKP